MLNTRQKLKTLSIITLNSEKFFSWKMVSLKNDIMVTLMIYSGPQREIFPGGTKVDTGLPNLFGPPKPYQGPCRKIIFRPGTKLAQNFFFRFFAQN